MSQLRRWPTPQSIYSHWSDSTPIGPSFPIHALAKPLSKFLYNRQAMAFIAKNDDFPLSVDLVEVLTTYLTVLVLDYLLRRALRSNEEAQLILGSDALGVVSELLLASHPDIILATCDLLGYLFHQELEPTVYRFEVWHPQLTELLTHRDATVRRAAAYVLDGSDMVEALLCHLLSTNITPTTQVDILNILDWRADKGEQQARLLVQCATFRECTATLLFSPDLAILGTTCSILLNIAKYPSLISTIGAFGLDTQLPILLTHPDEYIQWTLRKLRKRLDWWGSADGKWTIMEADELLDRLFPMPVGPNHIRRINFDPIPRGWYQEGLPPYV
ncbi:hypothetical protein B0H16DRAFT_1788456 [Mycena metata]|uniref:Uncharacterized protein n=1 Tax=Mycena metata TaxID=1033252 RepID=A0AAD7HKH3_9AGAR|nr:hypothetical protein B0H16DRAFT_1788456 [Mycena metata]